jgi:Zn-dependent protease with chaperone function
MRHQNICDQAVALARRFLQRFSLSSLAMFGLALASELPVLCVRVVMLTLAIGIADFLSGRPSDGSGWLWLGTIPTLWAVFALLTPVGSGWWWKQRTGGRSPSARERLAYDDAIDLLQSNSSKPLPLPGKWFVIDAPLPDAAVCGETLMLSRALLESEQLPAVIAHELGHLASPDGRITAALNRLIIAKPANLDRVFQIARFTLWPFAFARGGIGLRLTQPIWGHYWRRREYAADNYAAQLGQADELADFLATHALIHDHPIPYIWLTEHTHPPVELRIDRLRRS